MINAVRAKFVVQSITRLHGTPATNITLFPQCDNGIEENARFARYTPSGKVELTVDNPPAQEFFELGKAYYLDFSKAE